MIFDNKLFNIIGLSSVTTYFWELKLRNGTGILVTKWFNVVFYNLNLKDLVGTKIIRINIE